MTIQNVLDRVDELKANMMLDATKISFINELEAMVHRQIIMRHVHTQEQETCPAYDENVDRTTELLVPTEYGMMYVYYVMSKIDMLNQEEDKEYNNRVRFENMWEEYSNDYRQGHMPLTAYPHFII